MQRKVTTETPKRIGNATYTNGGFLKKHRNAILGGGALIAVGGILAIVSSFNDSGKEAPEAPTQAVATSEHAQASTTLPNRHDMRLVDIAQRSAPAAAAIASERFVTTSYEPAQHASNYVYCQADSYNAQWINDDKLFSAGGRPHFDALTTQFGEQNAYLELVKNNRTGKLNIRVIAGQQGDCSRVVLSNGEPSLQRETFDPQINGLSPALLANG